MNLNSLEISLLQRAIHWAMRNKIHSKPQNNSTKQSVVWSGRVLKKYESHLLTVRADIEELKSCQNLLKKFGDYYSKI